LFYQLKSTLDQLTLGKPKTTPLYSRLSLNKAQKQVIKRKCNLRPSCVIYTRNVLKY